MKGIGYSIFFHGIQHSSSFDSSSCTEDATNLVFQSIFLLGAKHLINTTVSLRICMYDYMYTPLSTYTSTHTYIVANLTYVYT